MDKRVLALGLAILILPIAIALWPINRSSKPAINSTATPPKPAKPCRGCSPKGFRWTSAPQP